MHWWPMTENGDSVPQRASKVCNRRAAAQRNAAKAAGRAHGRRRCPAIPRRPGATNRVKTFPKLRMAEMIREPFWEPGQPSRAARQRAATVLWSQYQA